MDSKNNVVENGFEVIGVNPVPEKERTMSSRKIFIFWAMAGSSALTPVIASDFYSMGLKNLLIAIMIGFLIGLIPAGLIGEMGRQIPVTSLVVARKTFGYWTSSVYSVIFTLLNIGFFGLNDTVAAEILSSVTKSPIIAWYIIVGIVQILLVLFGAKWLEYFFRYSAPVLLISYGLLTYFLLTTYKIDFSALLRPTGIFSWGDAINFVIGFSILAWAYKISTQTRFAKPYKNDDSKLKKFGYFFSSPAGIILPLFLFAIIGFIGFSTNPVSGSDAWNIAVLKFPALSSIYGIIIVIAALGVSLSIMHTNAMNLYPATADLLTSIQSFFKSKKREKLAQPLSTIMLGIGGTLLAIFGILSYISGFIDVLASLIIPFEFVLVFDWFMNLRYKTKINDYYKIDRKISHNIKLYSLIPVIIGTAVAIIGIGPYDYIFNYFPQSLFGGIIALILYIVIYYGFIKNKFENQDKTIVNYAMFDVGDEYK